MPRGERGFEDSWWGRIPPIWKAVVPLLVGGLAVNWLAPAGKEHYDRSPVTTYYDLYAADGRCLNDTPFDPDRGAHVAQRQVENDEMLTVTTPHYESSVPNSLRFFIMGRSVVGLAAVQPADVPTITVLRGHTCPTMPN
jgi:hypothetical protein